MVKSVYLAIEIFSLDFEKLLVKEKCYRFFCSEFLYNKENNKSRMLYASYEHCCALIHLSIAIYMF